jgi:hypothetical protein
MLEKLAQAGEGGVTRPPPFTLFTITYNYKVSVYTLQLRGHADTFILFHLYPYILCGLDTQKNGKGKAHNEANESETVGAMGL